MLPLFADRAEAGRQLADQLGEYAGRADVLVLALPRGGVPVAAEVARILCAPLDVFVVRKLGAPSQPELAMGAIASGGVRLLNEDVVRGLRISDAEIARVSAEEVRELARREALYRAGRPAPTVTGRTVILIDDGLATGATMRVAARALRRQGPARLVLAVPVAARETAASLGSEADEVVCAETPEPFWSVGSWYADFAQTTDREVQDLLTEASGRRESAVAERAVQIPSGSVMLAGDLTVPDDARGVVLFAHGSGSSRHSGRNRYVAGVLQRAGMATLLMDLLTPQEEAVDERTGHLRFDIRLLAERLVHAADWLAAEPATGGLPLGLFGASTGAGAALAAAAWRPEGVRAVVSRGGRPDLAGDALPRVTAPTLLIVGGDDAPVIALNEQARARMSAEVRLEIIPGATHLFPEPGTLEQVARLAADWLTRHLPPADPD